jgi:hypothetical protein
MRCVRLVQSKDELVFQKQDKTALTGADEEESMSVATITKKQADATQGGYPVWQTVQGGPYNGYRRHHTTGQFAVIADDAVVIKTEQVAHCLVHPDQLIDRGRRA